MSGPGGLSSSLGFVPLSLGNFRWSPWLLVASVSQKLGAGRDQTAQILSDHADDERKETENKIPTPWIETRVKPNSA